MSTSEARPGAGAAAPAPAASAPAARVRRVRPFALVIGVVAGVVLLELSLVGVMHLLGEARGMGLHRTYGWRMLPGIERSGPMWGAERPARTNGAGWRDRDRPRACPPDRGRIAVLGDSFTFGVGVDDGERYTDRLEAERGGLEVLNFGVNGYGTDQQLCVLREDVLPLRPRLVVCQSYLGNDLEDIQHSFRHRWPKPHFTLEGGALVEHAPRVPARVWLRNRFYVGEAVCLLLDRLGLGVAGVREDVGDAEALYVALVREMGRLCADKGIDFAVMLVHEDGIDRALHRRVIDALDRHGIPCVDLRPAFEERRGAELFNPPPIAHWSNAGHDLVAATLWSGLVELGLAP